jgi:serine/threonine-protein kinase
VKERALAERSYVLYGEFAAGGMASVHWGRVRGSEGFARTVAIKRLHAHLAKDPAFRRMFIDEVRLAARVQHPNVVVTLDVAATDKELFLVMDYVHGESLARLQAHSRSTRIAVVPRIAAGIVAGTLHGLHAAHEARNENGQPLRLVHRDVSPQNILVGVDGIARVLDFGVAKAVGQSQATGEGQVKGKLGYMAPEQLEGRPVDRRADVYSAGVVMWELLTGGRLFECDHPGALVTQILTKPIRRPGALVPEIPPGLDDIVMTALARDPTRRFASARQMAHAIESCLAPAGPIAVGEWVEENADGVLRERAAIVAKIEAGADPNEACDASGTRSDSCILHIGRDSHISRVSITARQSRPPSRKRARSAPYVGMIVLTAAGVAGTSALVSGPIPKTPPGLTAADTGTLPARQEEVAVVMHTDSPSASVPLVPDSPPRVDFDAGTPRTAVRRPAPIRPLPVRGVATATAPKTAGPSCKPPYVWASGVKVPKAECPLD